MRNTPRGFWAVWTTVAIDLVGFGILIPLLPLYAEDFGASPATIGALFATYSLAQLVFSPIWGRLSDRVGRRPILLITIAGSALGSLMTGLAGGLAVLFVGRLIDGASGASIAVARATVADVAAPEDRARLMGLLGAAFGLGFVIGPAIGGIATFAGPAAPFFVAAALSALNWAAAWLRVPETLKSTTPAERSAPGARPQGRLLRLIVVTFVILTGFSAFEATFSLLARTRVGMSDAAIALTFAGIGVLLVGVQAGLVGTLARKLGELPLVQLGLGVMAGGFLLLIIAESTLLLGIALVAIASGQGLATPTLASLIAEAEPANRGLALGWQQSAGGLARVVGPLLGGALFGISIALPYLTAALLVAASAALLVARQPATTH